LHRGEKQCDQDADDGDHYQQFNKRKACSTSGRVHDQFPGALQNRNDEPQ
jgi:hypothetical protein